MEKYKTGRRMARRTDWIKGIMMENGSFCKMTVQWILLGTLLTAPAMKALAQSSADPYANETKAERDARMGWWREARFGMFIHWGVYAVPAGTYDGKQVKGIGEWIMKKGKIPVTEYKAFAKEFNPVKYDPVAWARLAKTAGMRYIVITSKHHDGFALFPSAVSDWNVVDATPYGKDLIDPLADAARAEGLKFGLYYSQAQDWTHPGGAQWKQPEGKGTWDDLQKGNFDEYLKQIAIPQVGEILTRYQPDILWWDTPAWMNNERAERLLPLLRICPGIIYNNRLGGDYKGDTDTPEQHIPASGFADRDWEVCMTMNDTWGYKSYDDNWKSTESLIHKLCDIVSKGGNFLLNVGPNAAGEIPQPSIERLEAVGAWMDINSESIYGTTASPFHRLSWGRATKKLRAGGATLYLHVFDWPEDGKLVVPGLKNAPKSIILLDGQQALNGVQENGSLAITVPKKAPDAYASVIKLEIDGELKVEAIMPRQAADGSVELTTDFADLHNRGYGQELKIENRNGKKTIGNWNDDRAWVSWTLEISKPGTFVVSAEVAAAEDAQLNFGPGESPATKATVKATGGPDQFKVQRLGEITLEKAGTVQLAIKPVRKKWKPVNWGTVTLSPGK